MRIKKDKQTKAILLLIILVGGFLRFYKLDWGEGHYFHPDEGNIARAVTRINPPDFHPHFFAYGQFPVYFAYLIAQITSGFTTSTVPFSQAVYILRFISAFANTAAILFVFLIGRRAYSAKIGLIGAALTAFTPGLIQAAHFGTTESLLVLFLVITLYFALIVIKNGFFLPISLVLGLILGLALSTKINGAILFGFPFIAFVLNTKINFKNKKFRQGFIWLVIIYLLALLVCMLTSPYQLIEFQDFKNTLKYEFGVAQGKPLVFYTRQFIDTKPVVFQLSRILPFSLGLVVEISSLIGLFFILATLVKSKAKNKKEKILLIASFLLYFPSAFLTFAKWTRFVTPILPFFIIFSLEQAFQLKKGKRLPFYIFSSVLVIFNLFFSLAFFSVYIKKDIRTTTTEWMIKNIPPGAKILNEEGNVVDLPLEGDFDMLGFGFYGLEADPKLYPELLEKLEKSEYILVPSRRIFADHPKKEFPKTACYYELLFSGKLGFEEIIKLDSFPSLGIKNWQIKIDDEIAEETWSVFDHPVIRIYKKQTDYSQTDYQKLFNECLLLLKRE